MDNVQVTVEHASPDVGVPQFSIATPTRNALDKLRRCVGSVRGQLGVTVEHLVQDACSSDGTPEWLAVQSMQQRGMRGVSENDNGMYDAINRAWARGRGAYLGWLNADEQYLPDTLARVAAHFAAHPQVDMLFADYIVVDAQGRPIALRREIPMRRAYVVNGFLNTQSCTVFYRRRLWDEGLLKLDHRYRYAADKDLILRLAAAGAVIRHIPEYWALFGVDGHNLSSHAQMQIEAEQVRRAYGGLRFKPLRNLPLLARRLERLWRGAYRRESLRYRFALDEMPSYSEFHAYRIGGRYTLADVQGHASSVRPVEQT